MNDQIIVRILSEPLSPLMLQWGIFRGRELILGPRKSDAEGFAAGLQEVYRGRRLTMVTVLVPVDWICLTHTPMPSVQPKVLHKALPYALEDQLAEDVDHLHFVVLGKPDPEKVEVAVIKKVIVRDWLASFAAIDIAPMAIVPDVLCVPYGQEDHWGLILESERVLLRTGQYAGFAFQGTQIPVMLDAVFDEIGACQPQLQLTLMNDRSERMSGRVLDALSAEIQSAEVEVDITVKRELIDGSVFQILAYSLMNWQSQRKVPNLMIGEFREERKRAKLNVRWKAAAIVLFFWFASQMSLALAQGYVYSKNAKQLQQDSVALYRSYFPGERTVRSVKRQMQAKLNRLSNTSGSSDFLTAFETVGEQIYLLDKGTRKHIELKRVSYDQQQGVMRLEMSMGSFAKVEQFKQGIESNKGKVQVDAANKERDGRIRTRIKVSGL